MYPQQYPPQPAPGGFAPQYPQQQGGYSPQGYGQCPPRDPNGPVTEKQAACLRSNNVDPTGWTYGRASAQIGHWKQVGFPVPRQQYAPPQQYAPQPGQQPFYPQPAPPTQTGGVQGFGQPGHVQGFSPPVNAPFAQPQNPGAVPFSS